MKNIDYIAAYNSVHSTYKNPVQLLGQIPSTESLFPVCSNLTSHLYFLTPNYNVCPYTTFYANLLQLCTFAILPIFTCSTQNDEVITSQLRKMIKH